MEDQDERDIYARQAFEDEPLSDPFDGPDAAVTGSLEETEAALRAERDERDAAVEDDYRLQPTWEHLTHTVTPLHLALVAVDEMTEYAADMQALHDAGLPETTCEGTVTFNMLTGGLLIGALQLAGLLTPSIRPIIRDLFAQIEEALPTASEEESAQIEATIEKIAAQRIEALKDGLKAAGAVVIDASAAAEASPEPKFDASNN